MTNAAEHSDNARTTCPVYHEELVNRHLTRNYLAMVFDAGLYIGAMAFLAANTVLPTMIKTLGGPQWVQAMMPNMTRIGFSVLPILTAHRLERLRRVKSFCLLVGVFQRLPFLFALLALLFLAESHPVLCVGFVAAAPFLSGLFGGVSMSAYFELNRRVIPTKRLSSAVSFRLILGCLIGLVAGPVVSYVLYKHPGTAGFTILHAITVILLSISLLFFTIIKEVEPPEIHKKPSRFKRNLKKAFLHLRKESNRRSYLIQFAFGLGWVIIFPFLPKHVMATVGENDGYIGHLLLMQMIGMIAGNLLSAWIGDRFGGKMLILVSRCVQIVGCCLIFIVYTKIGVSVLYFVIGMGFSMSMVGNNTVKMELCGRKNRITWFSMANLVILPCLLLTSGGSYLFESLTSSIYPTAIAATAFTGLSLYFLSKIKYGETRATS